MCRRVLQLRNSVFRVGLGARCPVVGAEASADCSESELTRRWQWRRRRGDDFGCLCLCLCLCLRSSLGRHRRRRRRTRRLPGAAGRPAAQSSPAIFVGCRVFFRPSASSLFAFGFRYTSSLSPSAFSLAVVAISPSLCARARASRVDATRRDATSSNDEDVVTIRNA